MKQSSPETSLASLHYTTISGPTVTQPPVNPHGSLSLPTLLSGSTTASAPLLTKCLYCQGNVGQQMLWTHSHKVMWHHSLVLGQKNKWHFPFPFMFIRFCQSLKLGGKMTRSPDGPIFITSYKDNARPSFLLLCQDVLPVVLTCSLYLQLRWHREDICKVWQ